MVDKFAGYADDAAGPARHVVPIVPSDTADLNDTPKAIFVGTGGDVKLIAIDAPAAAPGVVFKNVSSGQILDVRARRVLASGTTAADLLALL